MSAGTEDTSGSVYTCAVCGHNWVTRKSNGPPKSCPRCRSVVWNKDYHICVCKKCGHRWGSTHARPSRCPGCHTTRWDADEEGSFPRAPSKPRVPEMSKEMLEEILELYKGGMRITAIALTTGIAFGEVYSAVAGSRPGETLRV